MRCDLLNRRKIGNFAVGAKNKEQRTKSKEQRAKSKEQRLIKIDIDYDYSQFYYIVE